MKYKIKVRNIFLGITVALSIILFIGGVFILGFNEGDSPSSNVPSFLKPFQKATKPVNVLFAVSDKSGKLTDTMVLMNYSPLTAKLNLLSIPRDTKVIIRNSIQKANSAYAFGGSKLYVNTISNLLQANIQYYVCIDISVVKSVVDKLGGVDFNVPVDMKYTDRSQGLYINLKKGMQHLDGNKAEQLLRFRKPGNGKYPPEFLKYYDGSDLKRIETQLKFLKEMVKQKANLYYISKANDILKAVFDKLDTNMKVNDVLKLASSAGSLNPSSMNAFKLSGDAQMQYGASYFIYNNKIDNVLTKGINSSYEILKKDFSPGDTNYCNDPLDTNYPAKLNSFNVDYSSTHTTIKPSATGVSGHNIKTATPTTNPSNDETSITGNPTPGA